MNTSGRDYIDVVYDEGERPLTVYPQRMTRHLFERFGLARGQTLLEIGCGRGEFLQGFVDCGMVGYGVDRSAAAGKQSPGATVKTGDVEKEALAFTDDSFDVVYSKSVIEHLRDPERLLQETLRVLKPGGLVITMTPDWEIMYKIFFEDYTHRTPFTRPSLRDIHRIHGFDEVRVERFRQLPALWGRSGTWLLPVAELTRFGAPNLLKARSKWVRFSKEVMLLSTARKPPGPDRGTGAAPPGGTPG